MSFRGDSNKIGENVLKLRGEGKKETSEQRGFAPRGPTSGRDHFSARLLREIRRTVISFIGRRPENKVHLVLVSEMERMNPVTGEVEETVMPSFRTLQEPVYNSTDLETMYERMTAKMLESFSAYLRNGSGWMFKRVIRLDITFSRNRPVRGSSYIPLPEGLKKTRALINVQNKDNHCFKWAILRHFHPKEEHPERIQDLKEHVDGFTFPKPDSHFNSQIDSYISCILIECVCSKMHHKCLGGTQYPAPGGTCQV